MKIENVLSLFDGMSGAQQALNRAGIEFENYYACEIDKFCNQVVSANFPNTIQLGDVAKVTGANLPKIDLLVCGSPCQGFSFAGKMLNFNDPRSALFFEAVRILNECRKKNPNILFLFENVRMKLEYELVFTKYLGVEPIMINSALLSAQNRNRLYWTNIAAIPSNLFGGLKTTIQQPKDKGLFLKDILESEVDKKYYLSEKMIKCLDRHKNKYPNNRFGYKILGEQNRSFTITSKEGNRSASTFVKIDKRGNIKESQDKASCFTAGGNSGGNHSDMDLIMINPKNCLQYQTFISNFVEIFKSFNNGKIDRVSRKALLILWAKIREKNEVSNQDEARISTTFQQKKILWGCMYGETLGGENSEGGNNDRRISSKSESKNKEREMRKMWERTEFGYSPQGRKLEEQFRRKFAGFVQKLPHANPQNKEGVYDLWQTSEGLWLLRETLPTIQKIWKSSLFQDKPAHVNNSQRIRRLSVREVCKLQTVDYDSIFIHNGKQIVSDTQIYKMNGNGFTIDVIAYIVGHLK